jgi:translation elongation factor EF-Tu-like GTPase
MPGDTTRFMEVGQRFAIRDGNKTVGAGTVLRSYSG